MGNKGTTNYYIGHESPPNEGKPHAKIIFKFSGLTKKFADAIIPHYPTSIDDQLVVRFGDVVKWNNVLPGEVDVAQCKVERSSCSDKVTIILHKRNPGETWPLDQLTSGPSP